MWPNLARDNCHSFDIFLWMITTLPKDKNSLKETLALNPSFT